MTSSRPASPTAEQRRRRMEIGILLRRLQTEGEQLESAVATREAVGPTDLTALRHVMEADIAGRPLTAAGLQRALGLTSGATTTVLDRLESAGHARRERDSTDRRRVLLRYDDRAREVGERWFAPLGRDVGRLLSQYSPDEVATIERFLSDTVDVYAAHASKARDGGRRDGG